MNLIFSPTFCLNHVEFFLIQPLIFNFCNVVLFFVQLLVFCVKFFNIQFFLPVFLFLRLYKEQKKKKRKKLSSASQYIFTLSTNSYATISLHVPDSISFKIFIVFKAYVFVGVSRFLLECIYVCIFDTILALCQQVLT